jgi:Domain of unknown function (DUF4129)
MTLTSRLSLGTPLSPDPDTARHWAAQELAHPAYASARPSLTSRFLHWLEDHLGFGSNGTGLGTGQLLTLLLVLAALVVVAIILVRRGVRFGVSGTDGAPDVLGGTTLTGAQHRSSAEQATAQGRYADAVREWMRAIARRLDERALLDPRPGRTADELAAEATELLPALAEHLRAGARIFDDVSYGSISADAGQAEQLRVLDAAVEAAQPVALTGLVAPTGTR